MPGSETIGYNKGYSMHYINELIQKIRDFYYDIRDSYIHDKG